MRLLIFCLALLIPCVSEANPLPDLQGDAEAVARVEKMYDQMGGREVWAEARTMTLHYRQLSSSFRAGEGEEYAWRQLDRPRERLEFVRTDRSGKVKRWGGGHDERRAWRRQPDGKVEYRSTEDLASLNDFWRRDYYTMFRRMALGDAELRYRFKAPNKIEVTDATGKQLCWYVIDDAGWLIQWGTIDNDGTPFDWYYGPYKKFGPIAVPAWGVSAQFLVRFEYLDFRLSTEPLPEDVLADPSTPPSLARLLR